MAFLALILFFFTAEVKAEAAGADACQSLYVSLLPVVDPALDPQNPIFARALAHNFLNTQNAVRSRGGDIKGWNEIFAKEMEKTPLVKRLPNRKATLKQAEVRSLYDKISGHPVVAMCQLQKYDPQNRMGYCFGRATAAHVEALRTRLQKESIRKVWAVGPMRAGANIWSYHVATFVRNAAGEWQSIDPFIGKPIPLRQWMAKMKTYDADPGGLMFFASEGKRTAPDHPNKYRAKEFHEGEDGDLLLIDLMKETRKESGR